MIDAFSDMALRVWAKERSKTKNWDVKEYTNRVTEKAFPPDNGGQAASGGKETQKNTATSHVPMETDPYTGELIVHWKLKKYIDEGWPAICREADLVHEQVHHESWKKNKRFYAINMQDPDKLGDEEISAYTAKIEHLEKWLKSHCPSNGG